MAKGKGKGKGNVRIPLCIFDEDEGTWKLHNHPSHAAAKLIENGSAVYPVEGVCPIDPPVVVDDEVDPVDPVVDPVV